MIRASLGSNQTPWVLWVQFSIHPLVKYVDDYKKKKGSPDRFLFWICDMWLVTYRQLHHKMYLSDLFVVLPHSAVGWSECVIVVFPDHTHLIFISPKLKVRKKARAEIDKIRHHNWPRTPNGKITKTQLNITHQRARRSALSQQVTAMTLITPSLRLQKMHTSEWTHWICGVCMDWLTIIYWMNVFNHFSYCPKMHKDCLT